MLPSKAKSDAPSLSSTHFYIHSLLVLELCPCIYDNFAGEFNHCLVPKENIPCSSKASTSPVEASCECNAECKEANEPNETQDTVHQPRPTQSTKI